MGIRSLAALVAASILLAAASGRPSPQMAGPAGAALKIPVPTGQEAAPSLMAPHSEIPQPIDPEASEERCVACRLALRTTGSLPPGSFTLAPEIASDGALVHVTAVDPRVRESLWQAMEARGALLEAMRKGTSMPLCRSCAMRRSLLAELEIRARRTPTGLDLAYASKNRSIVEQLHTLVREALGAPTAY